MTWPTPQDYVEAVQNPSYAFEDAELRTGAAELSPLGLPKVISGQFACVFKFKSRQKTWAVRCFVRNIADQNVRYNLISKALHESKLPFMVEFGFIEKGIRIKGTWYPILKMEWLAGVLLSDYVSQNVTDTQSLLDLAKQIELVATSLESSGIAHGDLQHGNIMVANKRVFLIDYDGMYVPGFAGFKSHELGHRNYQHPLRSEQDFNSRIDTFALWIIYLSILALTIDPSLWKKFEGGDDKLLFRGVDFRAPYDSDLFATLKQHQNFSIQQIAQLIEALCYTTDVNKLLQFSAQPELAVGSTNPSQSSIGTIPWWQSETHRKSTGDQQTEKPAFSGNWLADHLKIERPAFSNARSRSEPMTIGLLPFLLASAFSLLFVGSPVLYAVAALLLGVSGFMMRMLWEKYSAEPAYKRKQILKAEWDQLNRDIHESGINLNKAIDLKKRCDVRHDEEKSEYAKRMSALDASLKSANQKLQSELESARKSTHSHVIALDKSESSEVDAVRTQYSGAIVGLKNKSSKIANEEQREFSDELKKIQDAHQVSVLSRYSISNANISGIGEKLTARLIRSGIRSAADADYSRVHRIEGFGDQKSASVKRWRDGILSQAKASMPTRLDSVREHQIRARYASELTQIKSQLRNQEATRDQAVDSIRRRYQGLKDKFNDQLSITISKIQSDIAQEISRCANDKRRESEDFDKNQSLLNVEQTELKALVNEKRSAASVLDFRKSMQIRRLQASESITLWNWFQYQIRR